MAIKNWQSRETGNIGHTRPRGNQKLTIQRNWQHRAHKTKGQYKTDNPEKLATQGTQDQGAIKNWQSRETGNTGHTRRRNTSQKHNTICVGQHYAQTDTTNILVDNRFVCVLIFYIVGILFIIYGIIWSLLNMFWMVWIRHTTFCLVKIANYQ